MLLLVVKSSEAHRMSLHSTQALILWSARIGGKLENLSRSISYRPNGLGVLFPTGQATVGSKYLFVPLIVVFSVGVVFLTLKRCPNSTVPLHHLFPPITDIYKRVGHKSDGMGGTVVVCKHTSYREDIVTSEDTTSKPQA